MIPLITIQGPTASGKSNLAIQLAKELNTEIISADSRQIYRYLNIGTAKPTMQELAAIPHHMIDIIDPNERFDAGQFRDTAIHIIDELAMLNKLPIVCGGTGFYIKTLVEGIFQIEPIPDEVKLFFYNRYKEEGLLSLYNELQLVDPIAANKISVNDKQRILRALEVWKYTGKPISSHWKDQDENRLFTTFNIAILPDRETLYQNINNRFETMMDNGLLDEISELLNRGYSFDDPGLNTVGYMEFKEYFESNACLTDCLDLAKQHSRNYAKRQYTWYRNKHFDLTFDVSDINLSIIMDLIKIKLGLYRR